MADRPASSLRVSLSRRRVLHRDADPRHLGARPHGGSAPRRRCGRGVPRRSDQGGGGARARHPSRPLPADHDRALLGHRDRLPSAWTGRAHREFSGRQPRLAGRKMSASFEFVAPDHFTAGAIGPPGQRVFYLQSREKGTLVTLKSEKEQVRALAQYLSSLLEKLPAVGERAPRDLSLIEPIDAAWIVASIAVGYDEPRDRILVVANELLEEEESGDP